MNVFIVKTTKPSVTTGNPPSVRLWYAAFKDQASVIEAFIARDIDGGASAICIHPLLADEGAGLGMVAGDIRDVCVGQS